MGRTLVLLAFAALAGFFVLIYTISIKPGPSGTVSNTNESKQSNTRPAKSSQLPKTNAARSSNGRANKIAKSQPASKEVKTNSTPAADPVATEPAISEDTSQPRVKDDSTPVYSLNSRNSQVLRRLNRGEKLNTDVEVLDSEGRWSIVKGRGQPGFVPDENIEKSSKGNSAGKTKQGREH